MNSYVQFMKEIELAQPGADDHVSEVDISDASDLRATLTGLGTGTGSASPILVHFGDSDFGNRYHLLAGKYRPVARERRKRRFGGFAVRAAGGGESGDKHGRGECGAEAHRRARRRRAKQQVTKFWRPLPGCVPVQAAGNEKERRIDEKGKVSGRAGCRQHEDVRRHQRSGRNGREIRRHGRGGIQGPAQGTDRQHRRDGDFGAPRD